MSRMSTARRLLLTLVASLAFASTTIAPALGSSAQTARAHHKTHHRKHHSHKKSSCRGDSDHDHSEPGRNDGDGPCV